MTEPNVKVAIRTQQSVEFWRDADYRVGVWKEIRRRYAALKADAQVESVQKDIIAKRAVFLCVRLESMERLAVDAGQFDSGVYVMLVNSLLGCLRSLGLERKAKTVQNLADYIKTKSSTSKVSRREREA